MNKNLTTWISRALTGLVTLAFVGSIIAKLAHSQSMVDGIMRAGIPETAIVPLALVEVVCLALYLLPRTMVLGAILLTGYFGGAIVVHLAGGKSFLPVFMLGVFVWGGIYFRVPALQQLLPVRRDEKGIASGREAARTAGSVQGAAVNAYRAS